MKLIKAGVLALPLLLSACAVQVIPAAVGGSKADGTIKMAYEYGEFEIPKVDTEQARINAGERCKVWGYTGAQEFGGQLSSCTLYDSTGCERTTVTIEYQCIGGKASKN